MKIKIAWAIQSFFLCFLFNLAFAAVLFYMADRILGAVNAWVSPFAGPGGPALPDDVHTALGGLGTFVIQAREQMLTVLAALASAFTLLMWFFLFLAGRRQIRKSATLAVSSCKPEPETSSHLSTSLPISEGLKERRGEEEEAL